MSGDEPLDTDDLPFEEALARLEGIVAELEGGQMPLEEALRRFEEGTQLQRICLAKLQRAEARIEQALAETAPQEADAGGEDPFDAEPA